VQLFGVAYDEAGLDANALTQAISQAAQPFDHISSEELWTTSSDSGRLAVAAIAHNSEQAGPRKYLADTGSLVVLFDGFPVDREGRLDALDATELLANWTRLPDRLEGEFSAIRVDLTTDQLEYLPDILSICKTFAWKAPGRFIVSNSVAAIRTWTGLSTPDSLAVSSFLTLGHAVAGRSLVEGISGLRGGSRHAFGPNGHTEQPFFTPERIGPSRRRIADDGACPVIRRT